MTPGFLFVVQCLDVVNIAAYKVQVLGRLVNDELGRMRKETIVA